MRKLWDSIIMVTTTQLLDRANAWLKEKGEGLLNSHEIVYIMGKIANVLRSEKHSSIDDLELNLAISTGIAVCKLRGYDVPDVVRWRGKVVETVKEEW